MSSFSQSKFLKSAPANSQSWKTASTRKPSLLFQSFRWLLLKTTFFPLSTKKPFSLIFQNFSIERLLYRQAKKRRSSFKRNWKT